ncbi:Actin-related protein 8 [Astathelohania contejeani]|uniref:Actin-related protein 8 n=1 Tax=Astathelohania contejeani TaxID=164912 RepID=A0ABQ7HX87_9MICR|nr:Actin-related protein 8 [Thelohania contejeani]
MGNYVPRIMTIPTMTPITTPNKNIQSYFMKNEASYYINEKMKYASYKTPEDKIKILCMPGNTILLEGTSIDLQNFYFLYHFNSKIYNSLNDAMNSLNHKINISDPRKTFLSLVINDGLNRSEIISLIDLFLNQKQMKGILLIPFSLSLCFHFSINNGIVINMQDGYSVISFIEDCCVIEKEVFDVSHNLKELFTLESVDFAEEFNKAKSDDNEKKIFLCELCDYQDSDDNKMISHIKESHLDATKCVCETYDSEISLEEHILAHIKEKAEKLESSDVIENLMTMIGRLSIEKRKKVISTVILVGSNENINNKIDEKFQANELSTKYLFVNENDIEASYNGANIFSNHECSKEIWLTDKEWQNVRLRILKEKVLFNI